LDKVDGPTQVGLRQVGPDQVRLARVPAAPPQQITAAAATAAPPPASEPPVDTSTSLVHAEPGELEPDVDALLDQDGIEAIDVLDIIPVPTQSLHIPWTSPQYLRNQVIERYPVCAKLYLTPQQKAGPGEHEHEARKIRSKFLMCMIFSLW
jgi:hypothetical protein